MPYLDEMGFGVGVAHSLKNGEVVNSAKRKP